MDEGRGSAELLALAIHLGKLRVLRSSRFTLSKRTSDYHWVGGWVGPTVGLSARKRRDVYCPSRRTNHDSSVFQQVA